MRYLIILLFSLLVLSQDKAMGQYKNKGLELRPIYVNASLAGRDGGILEAKRKIASDSTLDLESLQLPFIDDFSSVNKSPYPLQDKWIGRSVFVNNSFGIHPPTYGVATFDAFDENGKIYSHANNQGISFSADTLMSMPIRLDSIFYPSPRALGVQDSIYLSFFYQPGGGYGSVWEATKIGNAPSKDDKLVLEMFNSYLKGWVQVWETDGMKMKEFCPTCDTIEIPIENQCYFKYVTIPIKSLGYMLKDFQFRFRSYSSFYVNYNSGGGQWNIDYVYLNHGRSLDERTYNDVGFVDVDARIMKEYTTVPSNQFSEDMLVDDFTLKVSNLSDETLSCRYRYGIYKGEVEEAVYFQPEQGEANANIYPFLEDGYRTEPNLSPISMGYKFPSLGDDTLIYRVVHVIKSGIINDFIEQNDTLEFTHKFDREYGYDDITAESSIGLTYSRGILAYEFNLNKADTLTALRLFFNTSYNDISMTSFTINVWQAGENDTIPTNLIYESEVFRPDYRNGLNRYVSYFLSKPLLLEKGKFFIGIKQLSETFMNLGFDQNTNSNDKTYYYYLNPDNNKWEWDKSYYYGSMMMRPAFRYHPSDDVSNEDVEKKINNMLKCDIYPNPVSNGNLNVVLPSTFIESKTICQITDMAGRIVYRDAYTPQLYVGKLTTGFYVLRLIEGSKYAYAKLVITK